MSPTRRTLAYKWISLYVQKYGQLIWSDPNYATRAQYRTFREEHVRDFYFHVFESLLVHRGGQWRHWWDADDEVPKRMRAR